MISELVARTFAARDAAHLEHWKTTSYAAHMALGAFYDNVITAVDAIVECYQGTYGKIEPPTPFDATGDIMTILSTEADWIEAHRDMIANDNAHIGNLVDNLSAVYSKTIYLLGLK